MGFTTKAQRLNLNLMYKVLLLRANTKRKDFYSLDVEIIEATKAHFLPPRG
ncbi:hypothetical protein [Sulfurospirillum deleyianum]|uniref:Uncharacterized protein n=1 Tax=Sulfurospirillum deleyianum (strain ATCC 51133 / DSM 6946 / 5175) TaxID=525898 RepID=D1B519_SULD5|nr:hypothetical protein [Sulfurospirillum deleyianum]ACZ13189.1 hypothetical protein Sdel_2177 [Sulfurospirillum deleyianum DSM 6946]